MPSLRILTWNVEGLESRRLDARTERICHELLLGMDLKTALQGAPSPPMPEVIALQEVVRRAHVSKLRPHLSAAGFALHPEPPPDREDYALLAVRPPWSVESVETHIFEDSPLARTWLEATLVHADGGRARVLTAHMESLRSGSDARVAQVLELDERLHADAIPTVFAGDTNLRTREWELAHQRGVRLLDAFEAAGAPSSHRHTWWVPAPDDDARARGFRFDRIWLDGQRPWGVAELRTRRRPKLSDHAALEVKLTWGAPGRRPA